RGRCVRVLLARAVARGAGPLAARAGPRRAGRREEAVDLHVQVDEASLDRLELGEQADHVGARGHVQEAEHGLHVAVDAALGLEGLLQGGRERLRETRVREQLLREPAEPLLAEAEQALQDERVVGLHPAPALYRSAARAVNRMALPLAI